MPTDLQGGGKPASDSEKLSEAVVDRVQDTVLVEKRRDQILDAALELFLQKGFASTTIRDICAKSGVDQASIYKYITNKHDILRRILNKTWFGLDMPSLAERLDGGGDAPFEEAVAAYLRDAWSRRRKGTLLVYRSIPYLQEEDRRTMRAKDQGVIESLAARLRERTDLQEDDPRAEVMANLIGFLAAFAPMRDWLNKDVDDEVLLRTVASGVAAMVDRLAEDTDSGKPAA